MSQRTSSLLVILGLSDNFKTGAAVAGALRDKLGETSKKKMLCCVFCFQSFVCQLSWLSDTCVQVCMPAHTQTYQQP